MSMLETLQDYVQHVQNNLDHYRPNIEIRDDRASWIKEDDGGDSKINDLRRPYLDSIDEEFSTRINGNGSYVGPTKGIVGGKRGEFVHFTVGPGEKDGFGWLSGRISISYELDGAMMSESIYFG